MLELSLQKRRAGRQTLVMPLVLLTGLSLAPGAQGDVWKRVDKHGVVHLSDQYMGPGSKLILKSRKKRSPRRTGQIKPRLSLKNYHRNVATLTPLIDRTAERYQLDRDLVHAVIKAESAYDPHAVSHKGAVGLMQLMPATAERYGVSDRRNPSQNVAGGIRYLRDLLLQFRSVSLALAAYNAGEGAVARHGNRIPPYTETRNYVDKVIRYYHELRKKS